MLNAPLMQQTPTDPALPVNLYYTADAWEGQPGLVPTAGYYAPHELSGGASAIIGMCEWDGVLWAIKNDRVHWSLGDNFWHEMLTSVPAGLTETTLTVGLSGIMVCSPSDKDKQTSFVINRGGLQWTIAAYSTYTVACLDNYNGSIAIGYDNGIMARYNSNGAVQWSQTIHTVTTRINAVSTHDASSYFYSCGVDTTVKQVNPGTGAVNWTFAGFGANVGDVARAYLDGCVAVSDDGTTRYVNAAGAEVWQDTYFTFPDQVVVDPVTFDVYILGHTGTTYSLRKLTWAGVHIWTAVVDATTYMEICSSASGSLMPITFTGSGAVLRAYDPADGSLEWSLTLPGDAAYSSLCITQENSYEFIYVTMGERVVKVRNAPASPKGYIVWTSEPLSCRQITCDDNGNLWYGEDDNTLVSKFEERYEITEVSAGKTVGSSYGGDFRDSTYQDGYFIGILWDSNRFYISNLEEPLIWEELDYEDADYGGGQCVGCISHRRNLFVFKDKSYEIYYLTDDSDFPFTRMPNGVFDTGLHATQTLLEVGDTIFWLADDMTVRRLNGYTAEKISTPLVDNILSGLHDWRKNIYAWTYSVAGHVFYVLNIDDTNKPSLQYDVTTGLWSRLTNGDDSTPCVVRSCVPYREPGTIGTDNYAFASGTAYIFTIRDGQYVYNWGTGYETTVYREKQAQVIDAKRERMFFKQLEIWAKTGTVSTLAPADATLYISWSDDMGKTFNTPRELDLGTDGEYLRLRTFMLGSSYNRIFKIYSEHNADMRMIGGYLG